MRSWPSSATSYTHFLAALALIGFGWNFMYTGGTTLLTESYRPAEKARTQGANDAIMFTTMALSSFSSGALVSSAGWERMNATALAFPRCRGRGRRWPMLRDQPHEQRAWRSGLLAAQVAGAIPRNAALTAG